MICKINYGLWAMVWAGLDYEIKGSRPIISNFWGPFFSLFRGKKIFYNLFENTVVSAMKSCIIPFYNSFFFQKSSKFWKQQIMSYKFWLFFLDSILQSLFLQPGQDAWPWDQRGQVQYTVLVYDRVLIIETIFDHIKPVFW